MSIDAQTGLILGKTLTPRVGFSLERCAAHAACTNRQSLRGQDTYLALPTVGRVINRHLAARSSQLNHHLLKAVPYETSITRIIKGAFDTHQTTSSYKKSLKHHVQQAQACCCRQGMLFWRCVRHSTRQQVLLGVPFQPP